MHRWQESCMLEIYTNFDISTDVNDVNYGSFGIIIKYYVHGNINACGSGPITFHEMQIGSKVY